MAEIQALVENGTINDKLARQVFEGVIAGEGSPAEVVAARKLAIVSDEGALAAAVNEAINANPDIVDKIKSGKVQAAGALIGSMKQMRGQADAARSVSDLGKDRLTMILLLGASRCIGARSARCMFAGRLATADVAARQGDEGLTARNRNASRTRCTAPCNRVARPGTTVRIATTTVTASKTIWVASSPSSSGPSSQIEATAMAGMVSPMLAMAEPKARLRLVWIRSRRAARLAASVSGSNTSSAITTPTNDGGNPTAETPALIAGVSTLARPTTATSASRSRPRLASAARLLGGSACSSASTTSPAEVIGRKKSRCRTVCVMTKMVYRASEAIAARRAAPE